MSFCPVCGDLMCDHTPEDRGQTFDEMMRNPTPQERALVGDAISWRNQPIKRKVGELYAHWKPGDPHPEVK